MLLDHAEDIVVFDVPPPEDGVRGLEAYRQTWPPFFEWQRSGASFEIVSLDVTAGEILIGGQPIARVVVFPGLNQGAEAVRTSPNGGRRLPSISTADARLQKTFAWGGREVDAFARTMRRRWSCFPASPVPKTTIRRCGSRAGRFPSRPTRPTAAPPAHTSAPGSGRRSMTPSGTTTS